MSWLITLTDPTHPYRAVAYALQADLRGGNRLPGELVADTIEEVRAMLPAGLKRIKLSGRNPKGAVEAWDLGLTPRSQLHAEEHRRHVAYHEREAAEHEGPPRD